MRVKVDIEVECPICGETGKVDWQITRHGNDELIVDTICDHCGFGHQKVRIDKCK